jgi:hypothetical protein
MNWSRGPVPGCTGHRERGAEIHEVDLRSAQRNHSRVRMNIKANIEAIAIKLQKFCNRHFARIRMEPTRVDPDQLSLMAR